MATSLRSRDGRGESLVVPDWEGRFMWPAQTVNLRPLGVGERIDAAIKIVRANFSTLARASLVVAIPSGVVVAIITASVTASEQNATDTSVGRSLYTALGGEFLTLVITLVVSAFVTAVCFRVIANAYLGQRAEWREALRFGWSRLLAVIWVSALTYLAILIGALAIAALIAVTVAIHIAVLTVLFAAVLGIAGFVAVVWFLVATRLAVPVLMLEDIRGIKAIRRALALCRGYWWSVFGTQFLAGLLVSIASLVVAVVFDAIFSAFHGGTTMSVVSGFFVQTIDYVAFAPFSAAILVVLTIDLRVRKEGFDIQLLSAQMGVPTTASALFFARPASTGPYGTGYPPPGYPPQGYPPQPGYPPQAYPQQPGYPPQANRWYPPGPGGYPLPPAGYPPQAPPPAGYPPAPSPPTGWPQPPGPPPAPPAYPPAPAPGWPRPSPPQPPVSPPVPGWPRPSDAAPPSWPSPPSPEGEQPGAPEQPDVDPSQSPPPDAPGSE
jgi:MFS family permease